MLKRRWARVLLLFSVWTFLGLFFGSRLIMAYAYTQATVEWKLPLQMALTEWYGWAVLAPLIFWLARRFPLRARLWWRDLLIHLPVSLLLATLKIVLDAFTLPLVTGINFRMNPTTLHYNLLTYWVMVGLLLGIDYYRKYRERELRASKLETRLAQAHLQVLRMQLQPHFLFNTLNAIAALMHRDVEAAERMLARLSELLRLTLELSGAQEVTLKGELEFLERYLAIEKARFGDRLTVGMAIEPETLDARVPSLLLQPLVENAVRHGIAPRAAPGRVEIRARRRDGLLHLEVRDNGRGLAEADAAKLREGIGLGNTRARLAQLYGTNQRFRLENGSDDGLVVTLEIPFQTSATRTVSTPPDGDA